MNEFRFQKGREVIMLQANTEHAKQNSYGKVLEFLPKTSQITCDYVNVAWDNGSISAVPSHWLGTFLCDDDKYRWNGEAWEVVTSD